MYKYLNIAKIHRQKPFLAEYYSRLVLFSFCSLKQHYIDDMYTEWAVDHSGLGWMLIDPLQSRSEGGGRRTPLSRLQYTVTVVVLVVN